MATLQDILTIDSRWQGEAYLIWLSSPTKPLDFIANKARNLTQWRDRDNRLIPTVTTAEAIIVGSIDGVARRIETTLDSTSGHRTIERVEPSSESRYLTFESASTKSDTIISLVGVGVANGIVDGYPLTGACQLAGENHLTVKSRIVRYRNAHRA
jgi:hypothetical protein